MKWYKMWWIMDKKSMQIEFDWKNLYECKSIEQLISTYSQTTIEFKKKTNK